MLNDYLCLFTSLLYKCLYNFTTIVDYELKNHHVAEVQTLSFNLSCLKK